MRRDPRQQLSHYLSRSVSASFSLSLSLSLSLYIYTPHFLQVLVYAWSLRVSMCVCIISYMNNMPGTSSVWVAFVVSGVETLSPLSLLISLLPALFTFHLLCSSVFTNTSTQREFWPHRENQTSTCQSPKCMQILIKICLYPFEIILESCVRC